MRASLWSQALTMRGLILLAVTLPAAILVMNTLPMVHYILYALGILCHETGHTVVALLTGHLAIPSFDLQNGGGFTHILGRSWWLTLLVFVLIADLARRYRDQPPVPLLCAVGGAILLLLILTGWDEPLGLEMGHGGQLVAGGIFLYRGLTGVAEVYPGERWLYGFVGWSLILDVVSLCWRLTHDQATLNTYLLGHGNVDNDFVRLACDHLNNSLATVVWANFGACLLVPVVVVGVRLLLVHHSLVRDAASGQTAPHPRG